MNNSRKIAVIRDFDNQGKAQKAVEKRQIPDKIYVGTTTGYTLEDDVVAKNFATLQKFFRDELG